MQQQVNNVTINQPPQSAFFAGTQHSTYTGIVYLLNKHIPQLVGVFQHHYQVGANNYLPAGLVPYASPDNIPMMNAFWLSVLSIVPTCQSSLRAKSALAYTEDLASYLECFEIYVIPFLRNNIEWLFK